MEGIGKKAPGVHTEKPANMSRRRFLFGAGAAAAVAAVEMATKQAHAAEVVPTPDFPAPEGQPREVSMDGLEGQVFADLYAKYTGVSGRVPQRAVLDFKTQLWQMWQEKLVRAKGTKDIASLRSVAKEVLESYDAKTAERMSIPAYLHRAEQSLFTPRTVAQASLVKVQHDLSVPRAALFMKVVSGFGAKDLLAESLTELMPGKDGALNRKVFSFLLKEGGEEYIERLPALGDNLPSFGQYQMTSQGTAPSVGAFLDAEHIQPGPVESLRGEDQHRAAFMLALENVRQLLKVKLLSEKEVEMLTTHFDDLKEDFALFIGAAHHSPTAARSSFARFAKAYSAFEALKQNSHGKQKVQQPTRPTFTMFADPKVKTYSEKLQANRKEIAKL